MSVWIQKRKGKRSVSYRVCWRHKGSKVQTINCGSSLSRAKEVKEMKEREIVGLPFSISLSVAGYMKEYLESRINEVAERTYKHFDEPMARRIVELLGAVELSELSPRHIQSFKTSMLSSGMKKNHVRMILRSARTAFNRAVSLEYLQKSPMRGVPLPPADSVGRSLNDEEIAKLLEDAPERMRSVVWFTLHQGLRKGTVYALRWEWLRILKDRSTFDFPPELSKNRESHTIVLHPESMNVLERIGIRKTGEVFGYRSKDEFEWEWREAKKHISGRLRFHDLKTTMVTKGLNADLDLPTLMQITGNKSLHAMMHYAKMGQSLKVSRLSKLSYKLPISYHDPKKEKPPTP